MLSTFAIGFLGGVYTFFVSHDTDPIFNFGGGGQARGFEIIGDQYGGCAESGCVSYRIDDSGAFEVIVSKRDGEDDRYESELPSREFSRLVSELEDTPFGVVVASKFGGICPAEYGDVSERYEILIGETRYLFDSCTQNLVGRPLFELLEDYFEL